MYECIIIIHRLSIAFFIIIVTYGAKISSVANCGHNFEMNSVVDDGVSYCVSLPEITSDVSINL